MIQLTRIHGESLFINEHNIQWIECTPDTTITFINGHRFIVKESPQRIIELIRQNCLTQAPSLNSSLKSEL